jgi:hypothetical protein
MGPIEADDYLGFYIRPEAGNPLVFVNRSISSKKHNYSPLSTSMHTTFKVQPPFSRFHSGL